MDDLNAVLEAGLTLDEIKKHLENGITISELAKAAPKLKENNDAVEMNLQNNLLDQLYRLKPDDKQTFSRDDRGMARLFSECFVNTVRYNTTGKEWIFFNGKIWRVDTGGMIAASCAKAFAEGLLMYAFRLPESEDKTAFIKFISRYGEYSKRKTLVEDARSAMFISKEDLDRNDSFFCMQNGVLNLDTGELLSHKPEYLLSKISNVFFDPDAVAHRFLRFINEIMENNSEKITYLQKIFGLSLTADTNQEFMTILYGSTTRNGKSTLLETISYMQGGADGYALSMPPETLALRKNRDSRTASGDLARLDGCRLLICSEPPKRMIFDAALLKTLIGRDTVTARHLYEREFQFTPKFKLLMNTNFLPLIQDSTLFTSGRVKVVEFNRHFTQAEQDPTLKNYLRQKDEIAGIFNWCLEGLRLYKETGIDPPSAVVKAVADYERSSDKLSNFLLDCMERTGRNTGAGTAYQAYKSWCFDCGYGVESKRSFFDELKSKSLFADRGMVNGIQVRNIILGYELIEDEPPLPEPPPQFKY